MGKCQNLNRGCAYDYMQICIVLTICRVRQVSSMRQPFTPSCPWRARPSPWTFGCRPRPRRPCRGRAGAGRSAWERCRCLWPAWWCWPPGPAEWLLIVFGAKSRVIPSRDIPRTSGNSISAPVGPVISTSSPTLMSLVSIWQQYHCFPDLGMDQGMEPMINLWFICRATAIIMWYLSSAVLLWNYNEVHVSTIYILMYLTCCRIRAPSKCPCPSVANVVGAHTTVDLVVRVCGACLIRLVLALGTVAELAVQLNHALHALPIAPQIGPWVEKSEPWGKQFWSDFLHWPILVYIPSFNR